MRHRPAVRACVTLAVGTVALGGPPTGLFVVVPPGGG